MKTSFQNFKYAALAAVVLTLDVACERESSSLNFGELAIHLEEVSEVVMIDRLSDEIDNMAENVYYTDEQEIWPENRQKHKKVLRGLVFFLGLCCCQHCSNRSYYRKNLGFWCGL